LEQIMASNNQKKPVAIPDYVKFLFGGLSG
jgi:hypothetical protein